MKYIFYILFLISSFSIESKSISENDWKEAKKNFIYNKKVEEKPEKVEETKKGKSSTKSAKSPNWNFPVLNFLSNPAILYGIAIILLIIVLLFLFKNYTLPQKLQNEQLAYISDNEIEENLLETDIDKWLKKAINEGNYQLAIRYSYLKTLKLLVEKNKLQWKKQYTNRDYLFQLYESNLFEPFKNITQIYERKWYRDDLSNKDEFDSYTANCNLVSSIA